MTRGTSPGTRQRGDSHHGKALLTTPTLPTRTDRRVPSRTIECPVCEAAVDNMCVSTVDGRPMKTAHKPRRRMAVRALNHTEDYSAADCEYARRTPLARRRYIQAQQPGNYAQTAQLIGIPVNKYQWWLNAKSTQGAVAGPDGAWYGAWLRDQNATL